MCPLEERLLVLHVMWQSPPTMTVFGMSITYGAMATAGLGLLFALASKVILKQIGSGGANWLDGLSALIRPCPIGPIAPGSDFLRFPWFLLRSCSIYRRFAVRFRFAFLPDASQFQLNLFLLVFLKSFCSPPDSNSDWLSIPFSPSFVNFSPSFHQNLRRLFCSSPNQIAPDINNNFQWNQSSVNQWSDLQPPISR